MRCIECERKVVSDYPCKCTNCGEVMCDECAIRKELICSKCRGDVHEQKDAEQIEKIRRSYIELYKKCPYSFYLEVCERMGSVNNIYAEIGIWLHEEFDRDSKTGRIGGETEDGRKNTIIQRFNEWYKGIPTERFEGCQYKLTTEGFRESMRVKGESCINNYFKMCAGMPVPWKTEERLEIEVPNSSIKATIAFDRINQNDDGSFDLLDYKTGAVFVGKKLAQDLQPALYIKCVEDNYNIRINRFVFLFVAENKERVYTRISDDLFRCRVRNKDYDFSIKEKMNEVSEIFQSIERENFDIPDNLNTYYCENQCAMYKAGHCSGRFNAKWRQALK